jgi:molecular chaperone GrpE
MTDNKDAQADAQAQEKFEQKLECEKKRSEDYLNRLAYLQADLENLKKRFDREAAQIRAYGNERLVVSLLEVVDELELALKVSASSPQKTLSEGVELTLKKLRKVLEQEGVSPIECTTGKVFDPSRHNAVATVERDDLEPCTIVEEIRKGYMLKDRLIRPCIVKVSVKSSKSQKTEDKKIEQQK